MWLLHGPDRRNETDTGPEPLRSCVDLLIIRHNARVIVANRRARNGKIVHDSKLNRTVLT